MAEDNGKNPLELSDEEILNSTPDDFEQEDTSSDKSSDTTPDNTEDDVEEIFNSDEEDKNNEEEVKEENKEKESDESDKNTDEGDSNEDPEVDEGTSTDENESSDDIEDVSKEEKTDKVDEPVEIDYKSQYEELLKPFKANGKEMQIENIEDARTLMQFGANYHKKMVTLKPHLKVIKTLENNGLLDPDKLNYMIDLQNKDPEAIKRLVKESGLDALDMDLESINYKPNNHQISDDVFDLTSTLDGIRDSKYFDKTMETITEKWDEKSRGVMANSPEAIIIINQHMESGIYGIVSQRVEQERMLGKLDGLSDFEAYSKIGDAIDAAGGFNHLPNNKTTIGSNVSNDKTQLDSKSQSNDTKVAKKVVDPVKAAKRKKAAGATKGSTGVKVKKEVNHYEMSDEAFEKIDASRFN